MSNEELNQCIQIKMDYKIRVLVAGIGGASLGTEIIKALQKSGRYTIFGCDISKFAFGHYQNGLEETFLIDRNNYVRNIFELCLKYKIQAIAPGGEEPSILLGVVLKKFKDIGVHIASNSPEVISVCSDKSKLFDYLKRLNVPIPVSISVNHLRDLREISFPCVIKPATGSGGSYFVFLAEDKTQAELYVTYLLNNQQKPLAQGYIPIDEGEFTIGILNLPDGSLVGSIALRRMHHCKLSVMAKTDVGLISTGYSQGEIEDFAEIRKQAENIAHMLDSRGPLNIQGRVRNGILLPFEINPRFSATTYLRAMAGFNEVDMYLQSTVNGIKQSLYPIRYGYYFRSLDEIFVEKGKLKQ